ncbi:MAG: alpha/beta fold hydrolase [Hydrogenophaga sp.]|uniref:Alpha/beta fold hydrolase n=1 Tax=Hydrogenophaga crocea TaxID=2716225 RepID=A0A6G8ILI9_9BURK|nr:MULTISPECIES: alpha/beta hydrolase [Hydrogenophaga]MBL0946292.1 alpha/beta fold hydrolase [Hydrogenophaga sp.]QIM53963.1 alpha/beta fold hydrolase [Hydrogenophaga crocea]
MSCLCIQRHRVPGVHGELSVQIQGDLQDPVVLMGHSILTSSALWESQAVQLLAQGYCVVRVDATGHGASAAPMAAVTMNGLAADAVAVLDALGIERAHYVGLSLGGMSGFGLGIHHADRVISLVLCAARADAPPEVAAPWSERIEQALQSNSCQPLARATVQRWFGDRYLDTHPEVAQTFRQLAAHTTVSGFIGCARAIQGLDYLPRVHTIAAPTTLIVGARDGVLPEAMRDIQARMPRASLDVIADAGHLPNIEQARAFNESLLRHFRRHGH